MESAVFGLLGVVIGSLLTLAKDWWFQKRRDQKDADYLAIHVVYQLDRFVEGCAAAVGDDGLCEGQPDEDGCLRPQVGDPKFEPDLLKVEWKSLPTQLLYEILDFPRQVEAVAHKVSNAFDYSTPPNYGEGFEERQYEYAGLGIHACYLATRLRQHAKLPGVSNRDWNPVVDMQETRAAIEAQRRARRSHY